jgi:hypothetical protein
MRRSLPRFSPARSPGASPKQPERSPGPRPVSVDIEAAVFPCAAASILDPQFLESMEAPRAPPVRPQRKSLASFVT